MGLFLLVIAKGDGDEATILIIVAKGGGGGNDGSDEMFVISCDCIINWNL